MSSFRLYILLPPLLYCFLFINRTVKCDDAEENLFQGINTYRASLNLSTLTKNDRAECLAGEIADQFKNQPCTNTTGSNTVPGTEPQFSNYLSLLAKCHLNVTNTREGAILPACIPNLVPSLVLSNFTQSQYSGYLNNTNFTGAGIGTEDNWIVVVLTTNTTGGGFAAASSASLVSKVALISHLLFQLVGSCFLFWN